MEKTMKARVQHKHDIEANWLKATNFTPLASEIIVYDPDENYDYPRIKIGDGETNINALPFVTKEYAKISDIPTKPEDIGALPDSTVIPTVPTKISAFENDKGYLTQHQSLDAYAKTADLGALATKDSLTASDVGALPDTTKIPGALSDLSEDTTHRVVTDAEKEAWNAKSNFSGNYADLNGKPTIPTVPTKISAFENDAKYLTTFTETDPTVPDWAKAKEKPTYTADEVGALPDSTEIPSKLSDLDEDASHRLVTDTEKATWNAKSNFSGSYNDLTNKPTIPSISGLASTTYVDDAVKNKVDKDGNKVLSTNDYTTAEKNKLSNIAAGAEVNVNADWNATSGDAQILNKPTLGSMAAKSSVAKSDLASGVQTSLGKADSALQPGDISDWAKQSSKPSYTKSEVGLGNVDNTSDANKPVSTAQANAIAEAKKAGTDAQSSLTTHTNNKSNPHGVTKAQVGLGNVDNVKQYSANNPPAVVQSEAPTDTSVIWVDTDDNTIDEFQEAVPDYVVTEAEAVIDRVIAAQGNRTFNLAVLTDFHKGRNNYNDDVLHACQAMEHIGKRIKLDAVAVLGDYTDLYLDSDYANAIPDYKDVNSLLSSLRFAPNLRQSGNHDFHTAHSPVVHSYIHGFSDGVTWGNKLGGYYYRDFADYKLRVISVNTSEADGDNIRCNTAQYQWFADSLDLSEKDDTSEWQILVLSHHPLDWWESASDGVYRFGHILDAYVNGKSWSGGGISCDYIGKNSARIIGNIHGHLHNLLTGRIHIGNASNSDEIDVVRMCVPEVSAGGGNTYEGVWQEETTHAKTQNTAKDTSVTICCIDLDTYTINAVCYGAGYDRTVVYYDPAKPKYKNMLEYAINSDRTPYRGTNGEIGYKTGVRIKSDGSETAQNGEDYCVTGFIPILNWDYVYLKNMNLIVDDLTAQPNTRVASYGADFRMKRNVSAADLLTSGIFTSPLDENGGTAETGDAIGRLRYVEGNETGQLYIRFSTKKIDDTSVVTINEPIVT